MSGNRRRSPIALAIQLAPLALMAPLLACAPAPDPRPNVLLLVVHSLRADQLGAHGSELGSPHFDALARSSLRFVRAYAASARSEPSLASILTGLAPAAHGVRDDTDVLANEIPTLAEHLRAKGYATGAALGELRLLERRGLLQGFDRLREQLPGGGAGQGSSPMQAAIDLLDELARGPAPWLLFVYQTQPIPLSLSGTGQRERYASGVRAMDAGLGDLVARLSALDVEERTLIAITADHGVALGERDPASGPSLYEERIRVPLLLRPPRGAEARAIQPPVSLLSLTPTLLELTGAEAAPERSQAATLSEWLFGDPARRTARAVFSQLDAQRAVIETRYKLILDSASGNAQLYDLAADPSEQRNLAGQQPGLRKRLERLLITAPEATATELSPP